MSLRPELGLYFYPDFITAIEEAELLQTLARYLSTKPTGKEPATTHRNNIIRFGSNKPFNVISSIIPEPFARLCQKLVNQHLTPVLPDAVTINEYYPGQVIGPHIDPPQCGPIISVLSLSSQATMVFTHKQFPDIPVELPPRSLVQMKDSIRTEWQHEIKPVENLRYSVVFRCSTPD